MEILRPEICTRVQHSVFFRPYERRKSSAKSEHSKVRIIKTKTGRLAPIPLPKEPRANGMIKQNFHLNFAAYSLPLASQYCLPNNCRYWFRATTSLIAAVSLWVVPQLPSATAFDPPADKVEKAVPAAEGQQVTKETKKPEADYRNELLRGRVVWLAEALNSQFGITTVPEVAEHGLAIQTNDERLVPIVENLRGRAFRKDPRLREMDLEILVRRYERQPFVQVVKIFEVEGERRHEIDYWCDVCAIIMFEYGPCSCCQDQNRLRKQLVKPTAKPLREPPRSP